MTKPDKYNIPNKPCLKWERLPADEGFSKLKVIWWPSVETNPGTDFIAKYRNKRELEWISTGRITHDDFVIINKILTNETYEIFVESVEGIHITKSKTVEIARLRMGKTNSWFTLKKLTLLFNFDF